MTIQTCSVTFSFIVCKYFSKCPKNEKGCIRPSSPSDFDGLPYLGEGGNPNFFMKMTAKILKRLLICSRSLSLAFLERPGRGSVRGLQQPPFLDEGQI